jgi:hypothetical protein
VRGRKPLWEVFTPTEGFAFYVAWCTLGIIGTLLTVAFLPRSLPFAVIAAHVGGYLTVKIVSDRLDP